MTGDTGALNRRQRLMQRVFRRMVPKVEGLQERWEATVAERPGAVHSGPTSPERVSIVRGVARVDGAYRPPGVPRSMPQMIGSMRGIRASIHELDDNPEHPLTRIDAAGVAELEAVAKAAGALSVGYAEVDPKFVFRDKAILHPHAVVLTQEMDKARIDTAPSKAAGAAVHETYNHLGQTANAVARYLRSKGYSAHAGHPLNGLALYPPLGQAAHLGFRGIHGLLITPEMGPTVRLAAVFTSIENLPVPEGDHPHAWIEEFCDHCRLCVRKCPVDAIYTEPIRHPDGRITCADDSRCLPYFATHDGCTICVAVCPFNKLGYDRLHRTVQSHGIERTVAQHV
ncbi:MAG: 4Fe-4S binding protein [Acidimicrobiia bacterium]